jgi:hypothetical protein
MTKLIKELEPQCWEMSEFGLRFNYEKYAKLIIEECELAFWTESCRVSDLAYEEYCTNCRKIQEHFKANNATT